MTFNPIFASLLLLLPIGLAASEVGSESLVYENARGMEELRGARVREHLLDQLKADDSFNIELLKGGLLVPQVDFDPSLRYKQIQDPLGVGDYSNPEFITNDAVLQKALSTCSQASLKLSKLIVSNPSGATTEDSHRAYDQACLMPAMAPPQGAHAEGLNAAWRYLHILAL